MKKLYVIMDGGLIQSIMTDADETFEVVILDRDLPDQMSEEDYADYEEKEAEFAETEASGVLTEIYAG